MYAPGFGNVAVASTESAGLIPQHAAVVAVIVPDVTLKHSLTECLKRFTGLYR